MPTTWITTEMASRTLSVHYLRIKENNQPDKFYKISEPENCDFTYHIPGFPSPFHYKLIPSDTLVSIFFWTLFSILDDGRAVFLLNFNRDYTTPHRRRNALHTVGDRPPHPNIPE